MEVNTSQSVLSNRMAAVPAIKQTQVYKRVLVDAATALTAALTVSPIVAALDKAVVESATKHEPLLKSIRSSFSSIMRNPYQFLKNPAFRPMLLLYGGTYFAANASDTFHSVTEDLPAQHTESTVTKLCTVTSVNLGLSLYKDAQFAKSFGPASALAIPLASYAPFIVRDCITLSASFHLPAEIAPALPEVWDRYMSRATIAQLTAPALSQWAATPLHLLALDLHARRGHLPVMNRFRTVASFWASASTTRMFRVIPAYGFGAVVNNKLRAHLMSGLGRQ